MHQVCDGRGCFIYRVLCCPFVLPLGMHHCSSWKLFLLYCWWAKSRTPQVISQISMDIPQMTVFELFLLFESSQLVTSVGCLKTKLHWSQKLSYPRIWHAFYIYCFHCCHSYLSWLCMPACFKGMCWDDFEETQLVTTVWATSQRGKCLSCPPFRTRSFHQTTTVWESWREIQFLGPNGNRQQQGPWCCDTRGYAVPRRAATCTRVAVRNGSRHPRLQRRSALWLRSWGHLLHVDNSYILTLLNHLQTTAIKLDWLMTKCNMNNRYDIMRWPEMVTNKGDVLMLPQDSEGQRGAQLFEGGIEAADLLQATCVSNFCGNMMGLVWMSCLWICISVPEIVILICFDCISYYENSLQNLQCQNDFETLGIALPVNWIEKCNFPGCSGRLLAVPFLNSANGFSLFVCFSIVQTERSELH